jgi:cytochrome b
MKTYIWTLPTRLFHWLLVLGLIAAYVLSEEEELLNLHTAFGYMVGLLILFRLFWGLIGPIYSRFSDFRIGFSSLAAFVKDMNKSKSSYPGHNPAASVIMLGIIFTTMLLVLSGIFLLASHSEGFFAAYTIGLSTDMLEELHEVFVNLLIVLVIVHLLGNLVDFVFNRKMGTLASIFTGYKNTDMSGAMLNSFQIILAGLLLLAAVAIVPYTYTKQQVSITAESENETENENGEEESED